MAYESTDDLKRRIEALQNPIFSGQGAGLANAIRSRRARKYEDRLGEAEKRNTANRSQELAMLLRGAETGMTGTVGNGTGMPAQLGQFAPTDPEVQQLAAKLRLDRATKGSEEYTLSPGAQRMRGTEIVASAPFRPEASGSREIMQAIIDGKPVPFQYESRSGSAFDMQNQPFQIPQGAQVTRAGSPQGSMGEILPQNKEIEMREAEGAINTFNQTAERLKALRAANPDAGTFAGSLATIAAGAMQEAEAIGARFGVPREVFDPQRYEQVFQSLNIADPALKSAALGFAVQAATAQGLGSGRDLSNRDVERVLTQVGANYSDPAAFLSSLQQVVEMTNNAFANRYEALYQKPYQPAGQSSSPSGAPVVTSQAQYDALPSGTVYVEDGQEYRKP